MIFRTSRISVLMQSRRDELAAMREIQEPVDPRLADTQHFQVHGLSQASQDEALDDVETDLQHILEGQENDVPEAAKKRRHMPGASTHFLNFRKMLQHSDEVVVATLQSYRPDACLRPNTILHNTSRTLAEFRSCYPSLSEDVARLILVAGHMIEGTVGDKPMLADSAALIWMIEGQEYMRVPKGFIYMYDDDGLFLPFSGIPPEAVLQRRHAFFIYLEGIFRRMKSEMSKKFDACARAVVADLQTFTTEEEFCVLCEKRRTRALKHLHTPLDWTLGMMMSMNMRIEIAPARAKKILKYGRWAWQTGHGSCPTASSMSSCRRA